MKRLVSIALSRSLMLHDLSTSCNIVVDLLSNAAAYVCHEPLGFISQTTFKFTIELFSDTFDKMF